MSGSRPRVSFEPLTDDDFDWAWDVYRSTTQGHVELVTNASDEEQRSERLAALRRGSFDAILDERGSRIGLVEVTDDGVDLTIRTTATHTSPVDQRRRVDRDQAAAKGAELGLTDDDF
ncbi:hypothetical protein G9U51_04860 [Calidifontibacter sp. DB0510]|uniref:Uncharacterized protein n=1 Tax=Metallococcus carri TaxID=1656884 RepID=A0A967AYP0_9MICO|nr:hypothetical protein [Metallococcus carri]NHN55118.1 hypothetical protein [Metallococcus carri]NOP36195.1 hypothetical protein [Calidifontibacter sp. DB2511S]